MRWLTILMLFAAPVGAVDEIDFWNMTREQAATYGVGYVAKGCNFDLDDDLIFGEPEDCVICNDIEGTTQVLEDLDNDGEFEVQTYIDSYRGDDNLMCGGPETPCRTVTYAKDNRFLETEGENIFCARGEFHEGLLESGLHNGQDGVKIWPAAGMRRTDWELPSNPTMIVGWDYNQNGIYAPVDQEDIADFDGFVDGSHINVFWRQDCKDVGGQCVQSQNWLSTSRWEVAHIRVREYGLLPDPNPGRGLFHAERKAYGDAREMGSHVWFHDIGAYDINKGGDSKSGSMMIEGWDRAAQEWMSFTNIDIWDSCGYFWRGGGIKGPKEHFLVQNVSMNWFCDDDADDGSTSTPGLKIWGTYTDVRFLNNFFNQSPVAWENPGITKVAGGAMSINTCIRDFYAEGNILKNIQDGFVTQGGLLRGCQERNGDNLVFSNNLLILDDDRTNSIALNIGAGRDEIVYTEDITVENNMVVDLGVVPNLKRAINIGDDVYGGDPPNFDPSNDKIIIRNNTFYSPNPEGYAGWFTVGAGDRRELPDGTYVSLPDKSHDYLVEKNIFANETADQSFPNYSSTNHPALWKPLDIILTMQGNVWELVPHEDQPASRKLWKSDNGDNDIDTNSLAEFSSHTGWGATDRGYEQDYCKVEFVDRANGDVRIAETDTCANGAGANLDWLLASAPPPNPCGNGICEPGENHETCPADCEAPPVPTDELEVCVQTESGEICFTGTSVNVTVKEE